MEVPSISPTKLYEEQRSNEIDLIDVRTPVEFREIHAEGAQNVPLGQLNPTAIAQGHNGASDKPLYVICRTGNRAQKACEQLLAAGCTNVVNVEGGTQAWDESGLPVVRGKKMMSLERQVRIAAGSLVVLGVLLGWLVHVGLLGIAAFVGIGLVFAGITDTCGMGMLLAKMPWNQVQQDNQQSQDSGCCATE